ncbi:G-protein coupled receptor Mth2-like [Polyergus mexicanus]|uniref:G-protein coupled receptor Mth2-like n=1 Tax=Polyergus mexicanus TaxID=615972 RepID=UPI0038B66869
MCGKYLMFWYCASFILVASSKSQQNFTGNEEKNDNLAVRYEIDADYTINYSDEMKTLLHDLHKKSINNTQYEDMQYEFRTTSMSNEDDDLIRFKLGTYSIHNHEDDKQISMEPRTVSTNANHKSNFMSHEIYGNLMSIEDKNDSTSHEFYENSSKDSNISNIIPYEMCFSITCIQLCCCLGDRLVDNKCLSKEDKYFLPYLYEYTNDSQNENKTVDELFQLVVYDPCQDKNRSLNCDGHQKNYVLFANDSLYLSYYEKFIKSTSYCLAVVDPDKYEATICSEIADNILYITTIDNDTSSIEDDVYYHIIKTSSWIVSISLFASIFLVYSILPELRNRHGFMLRNYSGALSVAYTILIVEELSLINVNAIPYSVCVIYAVFAYYIFLASSFWLNVMSFDMWWTFRGFNSLQRNIRQREKRKLVFYAIFAWGLPFIFAIITVIMDSVSEYLPESLRPKFYKGECWFVDVESFMLYYYGFESICVISSICFSISTALKIARYEKETGNRLTNSESKRYNDKKKWFTLYLKLFILFFITLGIQWSISIVRFCEYEINMSYYVYDVTKFVSVLMETMQNLCIFIIFVWKKNIKRMLLKRFGCGLFSEDSCATNATSLSTSTCITISGGMPMKKVSEQRDEKDLSGETNL